MSPHFTKLPLLLVLGAFACKDNDDTDDTDTTPVDTDTDTPGDTDTDTPGDTDTDTPGDTDTDTDTTPAVLHSVTFHGEGYGPHDGQMMFFIVKNPNIPAELPVAQESLTMDSTGTIDLSFTDVMVDGTPYSFAWYADFNGDGMCDNADHVWSIPVMPPAGTPVTADAALTYDHDINFVLPACQPLNDAF